MHGFHKKKSLLQLSLSFSVFHRQTCTHLNSKDRDSLAKMSLKKREKMVWGCLCIKPKPTFYYSLFLMWERQFYIHVQETPGASLAHTTSKSVFPLAFFESAIPFLSSCGQYCWSELHRWLLSRSPLCRTFRATGKLTLKLTVSKSSLITLSFTSTCSLRSRLTALATRARLLPAC